MLRSTSHRLHHRGMALIDAVIGGVLLGLGLAVVISLASRSLHMQTDGEKRLISAWLADSLLNMVLVEGPDHFPKRYDTAGRFDPPFQEFDYDLDIQDQGVGVPYRVLATVKWEDGRGERFVHVESYIAERGGDPDQPREPLEPVDREKRWHPDEY